MVLDPRACHRALRARDARFDGRFFVGVRTTGIYCRPICPAPTARAANVEFFPSAAAAQEAGYRPCLRCRPECAPGVAAGQGTSATVRRALALIEAGALDGDEGVEALAARLGVGDRQLRRLFREHLGASPLAVAGTRRVLFAKKLLHETRLPMTAVAQASGFSSLRRFNATFRELFGRPPSTLRRDGHGTKAPAITLQLAHTRPYDVAAVLAFLGARAIPGVEAVDASGWRRTFAIGGSTGTVAVTPDLAATIRCADVSVLPAIVARLRRLLDLDADVFAIAAHLAEDARLAPLVAARPGLRVPGAWDGFELAVRAVLGQQVSIAAARGLLGRIAERFGSLLPGAAPLTVLFPTPERLADAGLEDLGIPRARAAAVRALAGAVLADPALLEPGGDRDAVIASLRELPGIGPWTAEYVALRALRDADAFPASDLGLLRALSTTPAALGASAEAWRPWRGYAAQHLWTAGSPAHGKAVA